MRRVAPVLVVRDINASVAYWRDKVGFETDQIYGGGFAMPTRDSVTLMLAQAPPGVDPPLPNWRVVDKTNDAYVWVDDAEALYAELQARGATIDYTIYDTPWGTREFGIQDLDDHDITFGQVLHNSAVAESPELDASAIASVLLSNRGTDENFWHWLAPGVQPTKKDANKFLLACILDYQMRASVVWQNARRLAEDELGDPEDIWSEVVKLSLVDWMARKSSLNLHRFPKGHERVWTIGKRIVEMYEGDARQIWQGRSAPEVLNRLGDLRVGEAISRMIVGALIDVGQVSGTGDVKPDVHVRRVLGRIALGRELSQDETERAIAISRDVHAENPWLLDRTLYQLGQSCCKPKAPNCEICFASSVCAYVSRAGS